MQAAFWSSSPVQGPPELAGSSHLRVLSLVPLLHVLLQAPHDDQLLQWLSTGAVEYTFCNEKISRVSAIKI